MAATTALPGTIALAPAPYALEVRLTMLGAGVRAPFVLRGLAASQEDLELDEVVLHDADPMRLEAMAALGAHLVQGWGGRFRVRPEPDPRAALADARFVFAAIRPGQEHARVVDEEVPLAHGVLGQETTGPGGFAMALRTIPAMLAYARLIEEVAPSALLVNFTNPVGIVVQALHDHADVRVVGICDGPISMARSVAAFLERPLDRVHVDYAGLNHCGWIHRVLVDGRDRLPEIVARFDELRRADEQWAAFDPALVRDLGMLPMEYLYFFYERDRAVVNIRRSGGSRARQLERLNDGLWPVLVACTRERDLDGARAAWEQAMRTRDATYFAREHGGTVDDDLVEDEADVFEGEGYEGVATAVMAAAVRRRREPLIVDVANRGAIGGLADDDVVEVTCLVDEHGAHPLAQGDLPEAATDLLVRVKRYERLTVRAAVERNPGLALEALRVHPLVPSDEAATAILEGYVAGLGDLLPF
jgi:6-phospho-beta-glucosidase